MGALIHYETVYSLSTMDLVEKGGRKDVSLSAAYQKITYTLEVNSIKAIM